MLIAWGFDLEVHLTGLLDGVPLKIHSRNVLGQSLAYCEIRSEDVISYYGDRQYERALAVCKILS